MAPVGVAEAFVEPPGTGVVHADAQGEAPVAEPARGVFPRPDQDGADAAPLQPLGDLEMVEHGHAREVAVDLRLAGRAAVQEHVANWPAVEPGDQQDPASVLLPFGPSVR